LNDTQALTAAGYGVSWLRQLPLIYTTEVTQGDASTRLEWVVDGDYRLFPTVQDETICSAGHRASRLPSTRKARATTRASAGVGASGSRLFS
jgi:hypothetical protein